MLDFLRISARQKKGIVEVYPKFIVRPSTKDLMIKGGDFYAVWDERKGLWSMNEQSVIDQVDEAIDIFIKKRSETHPEENIVGLYMWDSDAGSIDRWHKFVQKQMRDCFVPLNEKLIFSNETPKKEDFVSKVLPYPLEEGDMPAYEELISTLYDTDERMKLEWAIGAIVKGDSKHIQKFEVLYGDKGTGKSTILNIISGMFDGFTSTFDGKTIGSANAAFALESFKDNPLVSIQHEGKLDRIEDNTRLNSIVSHEVMEMNAKYTKMYQTRFKTFLFMGTNSPVKITDAKSGLLRRLIDVHPSGKKVPRRKYDILVKQVTFEYGAIAYHCLKVYEEMGESYYDDYIPREMMAATNDFYDFIDHNFDDLAREDMITLTEAWSLYREYCEFAGANQMPYRLMRIELRNYFKNFDERATRNGRQVRNLYSGFLVDKFKPTDKSKEKGTAETEGWLKMTCQPSLFDSVFADSPAQYTKADGSPAKAWANVKTCLKDVDTSKEHYVRPRGGKLICVDFDIPGPDGKKNFDLNLREALKWPKTYAETSRSDQGIHLYYIYEGDVGLLSALYAGHIEIKTYPEDSGSALRRKVTRCNDIPIATLKSGLPLKGEAKMINKKDFENQKHLHNYLLKMIRENLDKKHHADTSSSINFIKKILDEAYESGIPYDVSDLKDTILHFAINSTNQSERCVGVVNEMHFVSETRSEPDDISVDIESRPVFFDVEVYQNFFCIVWKYDGSDTCVHMIDPTPEEVEELFKFKLIGFNNINYDNHILYARAVLRYSNAKLYSLSQRIIAGEKNTGWRDARNISYTDIFDFSSEKMSLKKWEIALGIHHEEMGIPWDQPVPEEMKEKVVDYCENDVRATEAVFHAREADFMAREIQVDIVKLMYGDKIKVSVNDTTNTLSKKIIFGNNTAPQSEFNYRNMSKPVGSDRYAEYLEKFGEDYKFRVFNADGLPEYRDYIPGETLPDGWSILPFFKGYEFDQYAKKGEKSLYLGEYVGEGGRVYSRRGYYEWVWDGDISSQHPHSIMAEVLFGTRYTKVFSDIVKARVAVKHKDYETAGKLLGGALKPYLKDEYAKGLAQALKIVINSIYGLTKAGFSNEFRDSRNIDNIVAKRGALFMTLLKQQVEAKGYMVCHIKTDSIKIPRADDYIRDFVIKFGREFGYEFETEGVFDKFCLLNDAAYIAHEVEIGEGWVTKADQFKKSKQPYLWKELFSGEAHEFRDYCETKSVTKGAIYLDMNEDLPDVTEAEKKLDKIVARLKKELPGQDFIGTDTGDAELEALKAEVAKGHNYIFVGRVGQFTPVVVGAGGGVLYRIDNGKIYAVSGTKGYRWLESANVEKYGKEKYVDVTFYHDVVTQALDDIREFVDPDYFLGSDSPEKKLGPTLDSGGNVIMPDFMNLPVNDDRDEVPWDEVS